VEALSFRSDVGFDEDEPAGTRVRVGLAAMQRACSQCRRSCMGDLDPAHDTDDESGAALAFSTEPN